MRDCDCCTSHDEYWFSGSPDIQIWDVDVYAPDGGPCRTIKVFGRELRGKEWLEDFVDWDLMNCYISLRADGSCSGSIGGT
jgi:hypothetical protein